MPGGRPKGGTPWNKGMKGLEGYKHPSDCTCKRHSGLTKCKEGCTCKRHTLKNGGQFREGLVRPDVSENMKQRHAKGLSHNLTSEERALSGRMKGKQHTPEAKAKISAYMSAVYPNKKDRVYPWNWDEIRQVIMKRDKRQCQICLGYGRLHVHHKDEDKSNCDYDNLVTLCGSCHMRGHRLNQWPWN